MFEDDEDERKMGEGQGGKALAEQEKGWLNVMDGFVKGLDDFVERFYELVGMLDEFVRWVEWVTCWWGTCSWMGDYLAVVVVGARV